MLVTYGEPPRPSFVDQLVYSWRILLGLTRTVAPIPLPLVPLIALSRARGRTALWKAWGYESPLEPVTKRQAQALADALEGAGGADWRVHVSYEFREPRLPRVLAALPPDEPVVVVPMYAAESAFTHALSRAAVKTFTADGAATRDIRVLEAVDAGVLAALSADHVLSHTTAGWRGAQAALVLAAHGTVLNPRASISTGLAATTMLCDAIVGRLSPHFGMVVNGWLNHTRGGRWTEPPIEEVMARVAASGCTRVVYYPYGFLADNAETELEGRIALDRLPKGIETRHLQCLNESPRLASVLAEMVVRA